MPIFSQGQAQYRPTKDIEFAWDTFRKGLNTLLQENEIDKEELAQADNILLKGKGIPTKRWGTALFHQAGNMTGAVEGLIGFEKADGTNELLAITDDGYLTKKNGASYSTLTGASWASGNPAYMAQLSDTIYIVNGQRALTRYSSPTLVGFVTVAVPVIASATNLSGATGSTIKSYRVSAVSQVGETLGSTSFQLAAQPSDLGDPAGGTIRLTWAAVSTASGILQGYNIYGRSQGQERFVAGVPAGTTFFDDDGSAIVREFAYPQTADSTGGPIAKYIMRYQDRLIFAGLIGEPSKILISGKEPLHERFDLANGGQTLNIEKDSGDEVTQLATFRDRIVVFKEKSIWQVTLGSEQIGNFFITTPNLQLITNSYGCVAPRSVVAVENDIFFMSRTGINTLGYQSGFAIDLLRSNEISLKVRTFFDSLTITQKQAAVAAYFMKKYIIAFPGLNKLMVFDTERAAWLGPWNVDGNVFTTYFDSDSNTHLLIGRDDTAEVEEMSDAYGDDRGTTISTIVRTRQEDFGDWSLFKTIKNIFTEFKNITGGVDVDVQLEQRSGTVITAKSFNVTPNVGSSGWGADMWGAAMWGTSLVAGGGAESSQVIRWANLNKAARTMQLIIKTNNRNDNYELLGIRGQAKPIGSGFRPSSWRI